MFRKVSYRCHFDRFYVPSSFFVEIPSFANYPRWLTAPGMDGGRIGHIHEHLFPRSVGPTSRLLLKMRSSSQSVTDHVALSFASGCMMPPYFFIVSLYSETPLRISLLYLGVTIPTNRRVRRIFHSLLQVFLLIHGTRSCCPCG